MVGIGISGTVYIILANHLGLWNINNQQQYSFDTQLHYNIKLVIFRIKIEMFFGSPRHNAGHFLLPSILFPVFFTICGSFRLSTTWFMFLVSRTGEPRAEPPRSPHECLPKTENHNFFCVKTLPALPERTAALLWYSSFVLLVTKESRSCEVSLWRQDSRRSTAIPRA